MPARRRTTGPWTASRTSSSYELLSGFEPRSNIHRSLLSAADTEALLSARSEAERAAFLRRDSAEEPEEVETLVVGRDEIKADAGRD